MSFMYIKRPPDVLITDGQFKGNQGWFLCKWISGTFLVAVRINHRIEGGMVIPLHGFRRGYQLARDQFIFLDKRGNVARRELKGR